MPIFIYDWIKDTFGGLVEEVNSWESIFARGLGRIGIGAFVIVLGSLFAYGFITSGHLSIWFLGVLGVIEVIMQVGNA